MSPPLRIRLARLARRLDAMWSDVADLSPAASASPPPPPAGRRRSHAPSLPRLSFFAANLANKSLAALVLALFSGPFTATTAHGHAHAYAHPYAYAQVAVLGASHAAMLLYLALARPFVDEATTLVETLATALELLIFGCAALLLHDAARFAALNAVASAAFVAAIALLLLFELRRVLVMAIAGAKAAWAWAWARRKKEKQGGGARL